MDIRIDAAVGAGAPNRDDDVRAVQSALKLVAEVDMAPSLDPGPMDGLSGVGTEGAIAAFQRRLGIRRPDARIDPDGTTLSRLSAWLGVERLPLTFPFSARSDFAYFGADAGMRAFGSRRSDGARAHAGIDLYFDDFTPVRAIADGVVLRGPYDFYLSTRAIEVDHGPMVVRYGEVAPESRDHVQKGDPVLGGQVIGRVGILTRGDGSRLGVPSMMLHLEMYDKTQTGRLTRAEGTSARDAHGTPFRRRKDLIDPTGFIRRAELPA